MKKQVFNLKNKQVNEIELPDSIFNVKVLFKALVLLFSISKDSINIILSSNNFDERADFKAKIFSFLLRLN